MNLQPIGFPTQTLTTRARQHQPAFGAQEPSDDELAAQIKATTRNANKVLQQRITDQLGKTPQNFKITLNPYPNLQMIFIHASESKIGAAKAFLATIPGMEPSLGDSEEYAGMYMFHPDITAPLPAKYHPPDPLQAGDKQVLIHLEIAAEGSRPGFFDWVKNPVKALKNLFFGS